MPCLRFRKTTLRSTISDQFSRCFEWQPCRNWLLPAVVTPPTVRKTAFSIAVTDLTAKAKAAQAVEKVKATACE